MHAPPPLAGGEARAPVAPLRERPSTRTMLGGGHAAHTRGAEVDERDKEGEERPRS